MGCSSLSMDRRNPDVVKSMGADPSKQLSDEEINELRQNTAFSGDEIREWYRMFHKDSQNGQMNKPEFMTMYSKIFPTGDARQFAEHIFKAYDVDGNGTIEFKEFMCTLSIASRGAIDDKLKWAFHLYDIDGNGYVTKKEAEEIVKAIYKMRGMSLKSTAHNLSPAETVEEIFKHLDHDADQRLSENEFIVGAKSNPLILGVLQSVTS